jgi:hypothetical protein
MVRGMGEGSFEVKIKIICLKIFLSAIFTCHVYDRLQELLPWLMSTLTSETSSVDRSGAAQGLAEVVGGLGKLLFTPLHSWFRIPHTVDIVIVDIYNIHK